MAEITSSGGGSAIHGVLVIVAAVIGVIGYMIRSRLNHIELKKQEEQKQEEDRRRAALKHCSNQLELYIGPLMNLTEGGSKFMREVLYNGYENEFAGLLKQFTQQKENTFFPMFTEATLNRLKENDEEAIEFLTNIKILHEHFTQPITELIKKYQFVLCELPSQDEFDQMYPGLKGKNQLSVLSSFAATNAKNYTTIMNWDGKRNLLKNYSLPKDVNRPFARTAYQALFVRWQYDKIITKFEFLFKEDMQRANDNILEKNKKYHNEYISKNSAVGSNHAYKVEVKQRKS